MIEKPIKSNQPDTFGDKNVVDRAKAELLAEGQVVDAVTLTARAHILMCKARGIRPASWAL